jgi:hypothetical protein
MKKIFTLILSLLFTQFIFAGELFPDLKPRPFNLGDKLEPDATIGGYPIWQSEVKWRIFELEKYDSTGQPPIPLGKAKVFQTEGKQWVAGMEIRSNLQSGNSYWLGEPCKREDMLFKLQLAGGKEDNCVTINHLTRYMSNPAGKLGELYALFKEQGIDIPPTVLRIQFTRNGQSSKMLHYIIDINPEVMGFQRESEPEWGRNPWNKTMSFNDPAKKQFIEALTAWATTFVKQMDDGLRQKPEAFTGIVSWRTIMNGVVKIDNTKPKVALD